MRLSKQLYNLGKVSAQERPAANLTSSRIEGGWSQLLSKTFLGMWSLSFMRYLYCTSRTNSMFSGHRGFFRLMKPFMNLQEISKSGLPHCTQIMEVQGSHHKRYITG